MKLLKITKKKISVFWLILSIAIGFATYHNALADKAVFDTVNILLLLLGGYGVILTIVNHTESIIENNNEMIKKLKYSKIENTYNLLRDWDDEHLFKARKLTRDIRDKKSNMSEKKLIKTIEKDDELRQSVILVLNFIDQIRFSINSDRVDKQLIKEHLGDIIVDIIIRFESFSKSISNQAWQDMEDTKKLLNG